MHLNILTLQLNVFSEYYLISCVLIVSCPLFQESSEQPNPHPQELVRGDGDPGADPPDAVHRPGGDP